MLSELFTKDAAYPIRPMHQDLLYSIRKQLDEEERTRLSIFAARSASAVRRMPEPLEGHRQAFSQDADRILHSRAYTRYIDKTQVFSLVDNDHITHRVLHVQLVSRIARTIGRFLRLNEDLIEAVALGHDIGHPPFGHEGERILALLCQQHGLNSFQHNLQSVQFLDRFERNGAGWNLTLQVLDGILCHDGEADLVRLRPARGKDFAAHDQEKEGKDQNPALPLMPMTLEGCVVRLADTIAYIGRDIEDAIELALIKLLGSSNGTIVYTLVTDLIGTSHLMRDGQGVESALDAVGFSPEVGERLQELKRFNYERIYTNSAFKPDFAAIHCCYERLFAHYLELAVRWLTAGDHRGFLRSMAPAYLAAHQPAAVVRDYLAGMTDAFFLRKAVEIGCPLPERVCLP
jgi:dGTPase